MTLEVCVDSVESAIAAQQGGAGRIELCADLDLGGTTPSVGMIRSVRESVSLKIHVMIRPRGGDFCYTDTEFELMKRDILEVKGLGIDGFVFGILVPTNTIDTARTKQLVDAARPLSVTFHRAFDETPDHIAGLAELVRMGVDRVLTSGGAPSVEAGLQTLAELVRRAGSSIRVLAGGGITFENVAAVFEQTGVDEIHVLRAVSTELAHTSFDQKLTHTPRLVADASRVRRMVDTLQRLKARK